MTTSDLTESLLAVCREYGIDLDGEWPTNLEVMDSGSTLGRAGIRQLLAQPAAIGMGRALMRRVSLMHGELIAVGYVLADTLVVHCVCDAGVFADQRLADATAPGAAPDIRGKAEALERWRAVAASVPDAEAVAAEKLVTAADADAGLADDLLTGRRPSDDVLGGILAGGADLELLFQRYRQVLSSDTARLTSQAWKVVHALVDLPDFKCLHSDLERAAWIRHHQPDDTPTEWFPGLVSNLRHFAHDVAVNHASQRLVEEVIEHIEAAGEGAADAAFVGSPARLAAYVDGLGILNDFSERNRKTLLRKVRLQVRKDVEVRERRLAVAAAECLKGGATRASCARQLGVTPSLLTRLLNTFSADCDGVTGVQAGGDADGQLTMAVIEGPIAELISFWDVHGATELRPVVPSVPDDHKYDRDARLGPLTQDVLAGLRERGTLVVYGVPAPFAPLPGKQVSVEAEALLDRASNVTAAIVTEPEVQWPHASSGEFDSDENPVWIRLVGADGLAAWSTTEPRPQRGEELHQSNVADVQAVAALAQRLRDRGVTLQLQTVRGLAHRIGYGWAPADCDHPVYLAGPGAFQQMVALASRFPGVQGVEYRSGYVTPVAVSLRFSGVDFVYSARFDGGHNVAWAPPALRDLLMDDLGEEVIPMLAPPPEMCRELEATVVPPDEVRVVLKSPEYDPTFHDDVPLDRIVGHTPEMEQEWYRWWWQEDLRLWGEAYEYKRLARSLPEWQPLMALDELRQLAEAAVSGGPGQADVRIQRRLTELLLGDLGRLEAILDTFQRVGDYLLTGSDSECDTIHQPRRWNDRLAALEQRGVLPPVGDRTHRMRDAVAMLGVSAHRRGRLKELLAT